jgi:uncharacterized protein YndB with AHSA1/START domain
MDRPSRRGQSCYVAVIEFELERTINAPIEQVFARLTDINGHNAWMPRKGSILKHTEQTSPGEPAVGTTFVDDTKYGRTPGEIVEFDPPRRVVYHWWDKGKNGKVRTEGWPEYSLEVVSGETTRVRHHAKMHAYGIYRLGMPLWRRIALRERSTTVDALQASFESP